MTSLTDLREVVDVVIGVDTHVATHSAAVLDAHTGGVLDQVTVPATEEGYAQLLDLAEEHAALRIWAIEGTGSHGAGLARARASTTRSSSSSTDPCEPPAGAGAKSDPLDAIRAAREALSRPRLGTPRSSGDRQALSSSWPPAAQQCKAPPTPNASCSASSSQPQNLSGPSSGHRSSP